MADRYTWNDKNSMERRCIEAFLREASSTIEHEPNRLVFDSKSGNLVIGWLRARLDAKPSEVRTWLPPDQRHGGG